MQLLNQFYHKGTHYMPHSDLQIDETAFQKIAKEDIFLIFSLIYLYIALLITSWHTVLIWTFSILSALYFIDLLFNFFLIIRSFSKSPEIKTDEKELKNILDHEWPTYTILCPLYKEWKVLPQFIEAMSALDYPKDKLQVVLLFEEDDNDTIEKIKQFMVPRYFKGAIVPHALPKTKPKALNYGMQFATGEYIVVYDAEDVPDVNQLKKAVLAFKKTEKNIVCIQAKLNFYNQHQNILTRVFTAEYSLWFDLILTGLQSINAPIPLGGTSNHFRKKDLLKLKGWDSFNVTEDADLGIRLAKAGYQTAIIDSTTHEEANSQFINWLHQRTRWTKGYITTYFVHMRHPHEFFANNKIPNFFIFQLIIGFKVLSTIINPLMWALTLSYFIIGGYFATFIENLFPVPIFYLAAFSLFIGNFLYVYYYMLGCAKKNQWEIVPFALFVPIYWLGVSISTTFAFWELLLRPFYWNKTKHGLHLTDNKEEYINKTFEIKSDITVAYS